MKKAFLFMVISLLMVISACSQDTQSAEKAEETEKIVIGYFPNLNHAPAMVAKEKELYEKHLGEDVEVEYRTFPDGSLFMTALATGEIQGGIVGPSPAMNNYLSGVDVQIIAASSTGGTVIVSGKDSGIETPADINDITFISPHIGCTHDVQFETYMKEMGITSDRVGGSMKHVTGKPAQYGTMFESGSIDVATAPEPWASVLEAEQDVNVVIDTNEVSYGETLPAAVFVTSSELADENPEQIQQLMNAHKESIDDINEHPEEAIDITIKAIDDITGQKLDHAVMEKAWDRTFFEYALDEDVIQEFGDSSYDLEFYKEKPDFTDFVDLRFIE